MSTDKNDSHGHEVTTMLELWQSGDEAALGSLMETVHSELHRIAASYLRRERAGHTLQATALVNEAFIKLDAGDEISFQSRAHFHAIAANSMRRILVDYARQRSAQKRPDSQQRVTMVEVPSGDKTQDVDVLSLDQCLERLSNAEPRQAKAIEYSYFGGLTNEQIAAVLSVSVPTVERDLRAARIALRAWMAE